MALRREITARITSLLRQNPQGLSITEIVTSSGVNRNTAGRYLDNLLVSGQVEMRRFGMSKIYSLSRRLPVSSVLSLSSELVIQLDTSLRIVFLNKPFASLLETDEKGIVGKNIEFSRIPPFFDDSYPRLLASIREGLAGIEFRGELEVPAWDLIYSYRVVPIVFNNGQKGVSVIFEDITETKHGEALLRESEEKFRALFNNANDMITLHGFSPDGLPGKYLEVNDETCRRLSYTREELLTMSPKDIIAPECIRSMNLNAQKLRESRHATFGMVHLTRDRRRIPVEISAHLFEFHGEPMVLALVRDITGRKRMEEALRESEARYRSLSEASQDLIFVIDREDRVQYINRQAADFLNKPAESVIGRPRAGLFPPDISARQSQVLRQVFSTGILVRDEGVMSAGDELRWFDHALMPILDTGGQVVSVLGVSRDITKHIGTEREIRENEQNYRFIAEHSVDIISRMTPECICTFTSPSVTTLLGYKEQDVIGTSMLPLVHPDDLPGVMRDLDAIRRNGLETITTVFRFRHRDGRYPWFESATRVIRDETGQIREFLTISRDITGRKTGQGTAERAG